MKGKATISRRSTVAGVMLAVAAGGAAAHWALRPDTDPPEDAYPRRPGSVRTVSVRDMGAAGDGRTDDTPAFQAAQDALPDGGIVDVPPGTYRVGAVSISHRHVTVRLAQGAVLRRIGPAGLTSRGMFLVQMIGAHFTLEGGTIDLNGEGPMGIGVPGRLANRYGDQTVPGVKAIAGPANAAIFALRSSHIRVAGVQIRNTGESALLWRNCGHITVEDCQFGNIANIAVEFSLVAPEQDGGRGDMPQRANNVVRRCSFADIDDYGLGTGNGVGVGGGGLGDLGVFTDFSITDCRFDRCQRDIHFEFLPGSRLQRLELARIRSQDARQGSFGLVGTHDVSISDYVALDPGSAPTGALAGHYPSIYGGVLSADFDRVVVKDVQIVDRRTRGIRSGQAGQMPRGGRTFRARDAVFNARDIGRFIGVRGANPEGVWYVGRIVSVVSPQELVLDLPAGATVRDAFYAYGGATREGLILAHGGAVSLDDVRIVAGRGSGLPGEPPAAGLRLDMLDVPPRAVATMITAPPGAGGPAAGVRRISRMGRASGAIPGISVSGFAVANAS